MINNPSKSRLVRYKNVRVQKVKKRKKRVIHHEEQTHEVYKGDKREKKI